MELRRKVIWLCGSRFHRHHLQVELTTNGFFFCWRMLAVSLTRALLGGEMVLPGNARQFVRCASRTSSCSRRFQLVTGIFSFRATRRSTLLPLQSFRRHGRGLYFAAVTPLESLARSVNAFPAPDLQFRRDSKVVQRTIRLRAKFLAAISDELLLYRLPSRPASVRYQPG